jgi:hypothetical protein
MTDTLLVSTRKTPIISMGSKHAADRTTRLSLQFQSPQGGEHATVVVAATHTIDRN